MITTCVTSRRRALARGLAALATVVFAFGTANSSFIKSASPTLDLWSFDGTVFAAADCPDIHGNPVIPPGRSITDDQTGATFVCGADGGWLSSTVSPTPSPPPFPTPPPAAAAPRERSRETLSRSAVTLMAVGITALAAGCGAVLVARRGRGRAFGRLVVRDGPQTRIVNLAGLPSPIRVGTAGEITLHADGVERRHAELMPRDNGRRAEMTLVPRDGPAAIHRHGRSMAAAAPTALCDGDEIDIGAARLIYRCIGARPTARSRRA